jgi:FkbM family methyltransferase
MIKDFEFLFKKIFFSESYLLKKRLKRAIKKGYEKELLIIDKFADKTKDALDVGVYRGIYSYKLSQNFKNIHSFEPNPLLFPYLEKNLIKIISNIKLYNLALSNDNGFTELKLPLRSKSIFEDNIEELFQLGAATMHPNNKINNYKKVPIKMKKLDDIEIGNKIGLIKIDVEGHEKNVLQGGIETVKNNKPVLLVEIEERHTKTPITEIITFINSIGYKAFISKENDLIEIDKVRDLTRENNFFFLPLDHKLIQSSGQ